MNQDLYAYIQKMHHFVQAQERRILELEQKVKQLSAELKEVQSRPPIHVDTIEYKFDQLKVENLDGTLNIGLNPSDLEGIEDFEVENKTIPASPKEKMKRSMELEAEILHFIETDLNSIVQKYAEELNLTLEDSYIEFIKEDLRKQLPQRIDYYLKQIPQTERSPEASQKITIKILEQMKRDIENAVLTFIRNLPKNDGG